ncbi:hypothetical protein MNBD_CHLOROFLEXI01-1532 [hydrothermal vent metagenome]|uniref:DUF2877 domain-containing protein n=1 Tax=hydrothermal vent metagenome TaxID=652676 RepID=A0A3B0VA79_9ZZZZ
MGNDGQLRATTITPQVQRWLVKPSAVSILHIFDQAFNLIDSEGEIISLVQPKIGAGPFAIVLAEERPFSTIISPHNFVHKTANHLQIGGLHIDLGTAELWQPRPNWPLLREQQSLWLPLLPVLQTAVAQEQHRLTVGSPAHFAEHFQQATIAMQQAIAQTNEDQLQAAVATLAGLGPGLTPAGDDFLLGVLLGLWATRPEAEVIGLAEIVLQTAVPRTTQLSAAWLTAAARGEAVLAWHHFVEALLARTAWELPVNAILDTGATSGVAALLGFMAAISTALRTH